MDVLRLLRVDVRKKDRAFIMANGQHVSRDIGYAIIRCGESETNDEVLFAQPGDLQLLGARTLKPIFNSGWGGEPAWLLRNADFRAESASEFENVVP